MTEPVDPDVAADDPWRTVAAVALGGVIGAVARYEAGLRWPTSHGTFPWTTLGINVLGCALIGVLVVLVSEKYTHRPLLRPFLGTGVLGGFTTFSTYAVDTQRLLQHGHPATAVAYCAGTLAAALAAVTLTTRLTRRWVR